MLNEILDKLSRNQSADVDLCVDELNDFLESVPLGARETVVVIDLLHQLLKRGYHAKVWESVFNAFGTISTRTHPDEKIVEIAIEFLPMLPPGCLVHAIPLIAESKRPEKNELLSQFLTSTNIVVRDTAERYLQLQRNKRINRHPYQKV